MTNSTCDINKTGFFKKILELYYYATGYKGSYYYLSGKEELEGEENFPNLCQRLRNISLSENKRSLLKCDGFCMRQMKQVWNYIHCYDNNRPHIILCRAGLVKWVVPIKRREELIGIIIAGCLRTLSAQEDLERQADYLSKRFSLPKVDLSNELNSISYISKEQIMPAAQLLFDIVSFQQNLIFKKPIIKLTKLETIKNIEAESINLYGDNLIKEKGFSQLLEELSKNVEKKRIHLHNRIELVRTIVTLCSMGKYFEAKERFILFFAHIVHEKM